MSSKKNIFSRRVLDVITFFCQKKFPPSLTPSIKNIFFIDKTFFCAKKIFFSEKIFRFTRFNAMHFKK